jgi:hypothetical protein
MAFYLVYKEIKSVYKLVTSCQMLSACISCVPDAALCANQALFHSELPKCAPWLICQKGKVPSTEDVRFLFCSSHHLLAQRSSQTKRDRNVPRADSSLARRQISQPARRASSSNLPDNPVQSQQTHFVPKPHRPVVLLLHASYGFILHSFRLLDRLSYQHMIDE